MYNGYTCVRSTPITNQGGSLMWRCEHYRGKLTCRATCSTLEDKIIRESNNHTCPTPDPNKQAKEDTLLQLKIVPIDNQQHQHGDSKFTP